MTRQRIVDPNWAFYPETILEFQLNAGALTIDLRHPLSDANRTRLANLGPARSFAVLTAFNPVGRVVSDAENSARHGRLRATLVDTGGDHLPAVGFSPDPCHREDGFAAWIDQGTAGALARAFDQSAYFWFDGATFWIMGALVITSPIPLPHAARNEK